MKPAFQKDAVFLEDVRRIVKSKASALWWLGQSGFLVLQNGRGLLFDPYLSDSLTRKYAGTDKPHTRITERVIDPRDLGSIGIIDLITSSHNHTDHLDAETLGPLIASNPQARLVIPAANREFVIERLGEETGLQLVELDAGVMARVGELEVRGIPSAHPTVEHDASGQCRFLGYVVRWKEVTIYHSGDTVWHEGLAAALRGLDIDIALLPINGDGPERKVAGNLDGREAAQLAKTIGAGLVIPCHFDLFEFNTASPDGFIAECERIRQPFRALRNGERCDI